jgi:hypothetical protein
VNLTHTKKHLALRDIIMDLRSLSLDDNFDEIIDFNFYRQLLPGVEGEPLSQVPPLPPQPMPNPSIIGQAPQIGGQQFMTSQGLTPTELALLSPEEQQMRLRQRGLV